MITYHNAPRQRPIETGGEIVEHHHPLASIDERMNPVAADIAGAASDQDRHAVDWLLDGPSSLREALRLQAVLDASMVRCARGLSRSFSSNTIRDSTASAIMSEAPTLFEYAAARGSNALA